jgi:hypothetical protein
MVNLQFYDNYRGSELEENWNNIENTSLRGFLYDINFC